jgi:peptidyl-prolyl cis-trans isomerase D
VIKVTEIQEAQAVGLDAVKGEVATDLLAGDRAKEIARRRAGEALGALKAGKSLSDLFPADGKRQVTFGGQPLQVEETGPVTAAAAAASVPRLGPAPELVKAAFAADGPKVLDGVFDTAAGPVVARVKERQKADPAEFDARKGEVAEALRARREAQIEQAWVRALREKGSVTVNEQLAGKPGLASVGG